MLQIFTVACFALKLMCLEFKADLDGHTKGFGYVNTYWKLLFNAYLNF